MITATARSMTLPRLINSRNSFSIFDFSHANDVQAPDASQSTCAQRYTISATLFATCNLRRKAWHCRRDFEKTCARS
jgi:hypothetical protein